MKFRDILEEPMARNLAMRRGGKEHFTNRHHYRESGSATA
jgi:hypothetical protein